MTELEPKLIRTYLARRGDDDSTLAKAERRLAKAGEAVATALDRKDYLVGGRFTIADVVVGGVLESARSYELLPDLPELRCYLDRLDQTAGEAARLRRTGSVVVELLAVLS